MTLPKPIRWAVTTALLLVFTGITLFVSAGVRGKDLDVSYIGCRMVAEGAPEALYRHDHSFGHHVPTDARWLAIAEEIGSGSEVYTYVQTPLWAMGLQPLCTTLDHSGFTTFFIGLNTLAFGLLAMLAMQLSAPRQGPLVLLAALSVLWLSVPFQYATGLVQPHILFILAAFAAMLLVERDRPVSAGLLLAIAATVKIVPGILVLYWLGTCRFKAAGAFVAFCALLGLLTWALSGTAMMTAYIAELSHMSGEANSTYFNQSLINFIRSIFVVAGDASALAVTPPLLNVLTWSLCALSVYTAGWLRHRGASAGATLSAALVGMTVFAPLTWTHYYVILIVPMIWMMGQRTLLPFALLIAAAWMVPHSPLFHFFILGLAIGAVCFLVACREAELLDHTPRQKQTARL